jgi:8-oxo-dGTP diphosphatase
VKLLLAIWKLLPLSKHVQLWIMGLRESKFLVGVTGVILNDRREILLFKHTYRKQPWGLPGGYAKRGEHPRETLEREIREESGFDVSAHTELKIRTDRETSRLEIAFGGTYLSGVFRPSAEVCEARFFPFGDLPALSRNELLLIRRALDEPGAHSAGVPKEKGIRVWKRLRTHLFPE